MTIRVVVVAGLLCISALAAQTSDEFRTMLDTSRLFALRDAVERGPSNVPPLYRGAVEASLNQVEPARRDLQKFIQSDPHSKEASNAREMLANMASRNGRNGEALRWLEDAHAADPSSAEISNVLPAFQAFAAADMKVVRLKSSSVDCKDGLPVVINGKAVTYGFDTGGAQSVMGASDAKMLGLELQHVSTRASEASGTSVPGFDVAVAKDVVISGLHLRNVVFLVFPDTGEPFVHFPVGQRGLLGLPILIAMQAVRWEPAANRCEFGPKVRVKEPTLRNLMFDGMKPIVQLSVEGKPLVFSLDTGAVDTDLNEGFAKALPDIVKSGHKERRAITGYGGSNYYDSVLMGPVVFRLGGLDATLKAPHVFTSHSFGKFDGNLGNDILNQAKAVTLDFKAMELRLE